jgi:hypothetical protein
MTIEYVTVPINSKDKTYLQQTARERGKSLNDICRIALQAYVFALKTKKRHAKEG